MSEPLRIVRYVALVFALLFWYQTAGGASGIASSHHPGCSGYCDYAKSCTDACEIPVGEIWQITTCGEYLEGWDGGYCEIPEDVWDAYVEPLIPPAEEVNVYAPSDEYDTASIAAWEDAIDDIETAIGEDVDDMAEVDTLLGILQSYGLIDELPDFQSNAEMATALQLPLGALALEGDPDHDLSGLVTSDASRQITCDQKWANVGKGAVKLGVVAAVGVVANGAAIAVPALVPFVAKLNWMLGAAAIKIGVDIVADVAEPCVSSSPIPGNLAFLKQY